MKLDEPWVTERHWEIIRKQLRLPPGMAVTVKQRADYLAISAHMDTVDSYNSKERAQIESGTPLYMGMYTVRMVLSAIMREVERLWTHELHEWCKIGDEFLFGDPHG